MECNKEEAYKAKEIAERKLAARDFEGAKRFAIKAERLYPTVDGIRHLLATLDVYICAEKKINGEVDWYGVLGLEPSSDEETIRKQYKKLALTLHPDKNKSVGANEAFTILTEAWNLLSNKDKRLAYNNKLKPREMPAKVPDRRQPFPTPHQGPAPSSSTPDCSNFWTVCRNCNTYNHLPRAFLKNYFPCRSCRQSFFTFEVPAPPSYMQGGQYSTQHQSTFQPVNMQGVHSTQNQSMQNPAAAPKPDAFHGANVSKSTKTQNSGAPGNKVGQSSNMQHVNTSKSAKADPSSSMQGVSSKKNKRSENLNENRAQEDAYMRPVVMGLASAKSGINVKFRVGGSSKLK